MTLAVAFACIVVLISISVLFIHFDEIYKDKDDEDNNEKYH